MLELEVAGAVRELTEEEILPPAAPIKIGRLRDSHHALARALAHGLTPFQASVQTGYSASRVSTLQNDPAFQELVKFYRADSETVARDVEHMFMLTGMDFMQEAMERLHDSPETFNNPVLLEYIKVFMDRAGFSPVNKSVTKNLNVNIGDRMDAIRRKKEAA